MDRIIINLFKNKLYVHFSINANAIYMLCLFLFN